MANCAQAFCLRSSQVFLNHRKLSCRSKAGQSVSPESSGRNPRRIQTPRNSTCRRTSIAVRRKGQEREIPNWQNPLRTKCSDQKPLGVFSFDLYCSDRQRLCCSRFLNSARRLPIPPLAVLRSLAPSFLSREAGPALPQAPAPREKLPASRVSTATHLG